MNNIIPRWEWRTFGGDLAEASARLQASGVSGVESSDEVYLLSAPVDANVKIRAGLLEIKQLEQTDSEGLQQWCPVLKTELPVPAEIVALIFAGLGIPLPRLRRSDYALDELREDLIRPEPRLRALEVHKERVRYRMGACACEVTKVIAEGHRVTTLAVESEDPAAVTATVKALGLGAVPNRSYPQGLKALVGMSEGLPESRLDPHGRRFAVIDLGTNSVKLHIAERDSTGRWSPVVDRSEVTRLGEGLADTGRIAPEAQERTLAAIRGMVEEARGLGAERVVAVGTMGMRSAANSDEFVAQVQANCGVTIEVISGEDEARLAYLAVRESLGIPGGAVVVFDTGGGSTQVTLGSDGRILERFSLNLGAARLTERFGLDGPVSPGTLGAARRAIAGELGRLDALPHPETLVGMGGAVTNLTSVSLSLSPDDPIRIQGATLTRSEVERQIERYAALDAAGRGEIPGLQPGRAKVILAGALVVATLMDKLAQDRLLVSDRGLRHGVLLERFRAI